MIASRWHDISCGHKVTGHEGKCKHLHGHNYRIHLHCEGERDQVGRVVDFSVIKAAFMEIENLMDHRFLIWENDPDAPALLKIDPTVVLTPFNPTAENIALYFLRHPPSALVGVKLVRVTVEETSRCSATVAA